MKKLVRLVFMTVVLSMAMGIHAWAGWYQNAAGTWYYSDSNGQNMTDFQYIDGKWYFLSTREDESKGAMLTGIQWIVGKCFYLNPDDGGAVAFNMDYGGYHFGPKGYAISEIGNPLMLVGWSMDSRMEFDENLLASPPKINPCVEPANDANADVLKIFRANYPGSLIDKVIQSAIDPMPEGKKLRRGIALDLRSTLTSEVTINVMYKLAGKKIPYEPWGPDAQYTYDWLVQFYRSYDWENATDEEKAYYIYEYLGERYGYGQAKGTHGNGNDFESVALLPWYLSSPTMICQNFSDVYYILGTTVGLDVGTCGYAEGYPWHVFNLIRTDGEIYCADVSGYAKYGKKSSYFGPWEDVFFYSISEWPEFYEGEDIFIDADVQQY